MSFVTRYIKSKSGNLILISGLDKYGVGCYFYILKNESCKDSLIQGNVINIGDIGKIIQSGFGMEPPNRIKARMKKIYDFE
jgi:hypothetical protein